MEPSTLLWCHITEDRINVHCSEYLIGHTMPFVVYQQLPMINAQNDV